MKIFKITYQDKALNRTHIELEATDYIDAVVKVFGNKRADQKLLYIEFIGEKVYET